MYRNTRDCTVSHQETRRDEDGDYEVTVQVRARFHRFADDWTIVEDRKIPFTSAIVEHEDGIVRKVAPDRLTFTDNSGYA